MKNQTLGRAITASLAIAAGATDATAKTVAREECHDEVTTRTVEPKDKNQNAGTAVGAVIGGVLGNQFGSGGGKKLATVGGAVAGGYAGNKIQENNTYQKTTRICKTVYDKA